MAYGVKRGIKTPGEFGIVDYIGLSIAGAAGIIFALVVDYQQKGEASAIYTLNQWVVGFSAMMGITQVPLYFVVLGMIAIGAGSIFYFQPITRQGAFAQGFGLLAVMMTAVPADIGANLQSVGGMDMDGLAPLEAPAADDSAGLEEAGVVSASLTARRVGGEASKISGINPAQQPAAAESGGVVLVQATRSSQYDVTLVINFTNGLPANFDSMVRRGLIRGRLHNEATGRTYNLFRSSGSTLTRRGNTLTIRAGVPAGAKTSTNLWVRIEADKHKIEQQSAKVTVGKPVRWTIDLQPSNTPLVMQRLGQSYWF